MEAATKTVAVKKETIEVQKHPEDQASPRTVIVKTVEGFLAGFVNNTLGKKTRHRNYSVRKEGSVEKLIYTAYRNQYSQQSQMTERNVDGSEELAVRLEGGLVLSNANRLEWCGTHIAWGGSRTSHYGQAPAQEVLEKAGAIPVPFSVFKQAKLDILRARVVQKAPSETVTVLTERWQNGKQIKKDENRHYVGACILEVDTNYFLFDIDREELKHKILNPFVVKLPRPAESVEEAYLALKPAKVLMAEMEGTPVVRQGEWFFLKRHEELPELATPSEELKKVAGSPPDAKKMGATSVERYYKQGDSYGYSFSDSKLEKAFEQKGKEWEKASEELRGYSPQEGELRQGNNRPNRVELFIRFNGEVLVSGKVQHTGREHRDLMLKGWWEAVPNTAVESWQVSGDVD